MTCLRINPTNSVEFVYEIQRTLSKAQSTPIVGPLFVSPVKALVGLAQFVTGFALTIINGSLASVFNNRTIDENFKSSLMHTGVGLASLGYSLVNMITLGMFGHSIER